MFTEKDYNEGVTKYNQSMQTSQKSMSKKSQYTNDK
jgi:hypothetical protein